MVEAEFHDAQGDRMIGQLWDVSSAGACLQLRHHVPIAENALGLLLLRQPFGSDQFSLPVQVCWSSPSRHVTFLGMVFSDGLLSPGTFLDDYMKASWVERMQSYREDGLI
jgi:hypothetical protein